jgi:hypothetical protein
MDGRLSNALRLKQFSRCHCKKWRCGRSETRTGRSARPDLLMIERMLSGSFVCREINISRSSAKLIRPRSNIQCAVPERAIPLLTISGPFFSTGRMCAAATSARPLPLISLIPVTAQRSSEAHKTTRRNTLWRSLSLGSNRRRVGARTIRASLVKRATYREFPSQRARGHLSSRLRPPGQLAAETPKKIPGQAVA